MSETRSSKGRSRAAKPQANQSGFTLRLEPALRKRVGAVAAKEHRSVAGYLAMLIERDLAEREAAQRVVRVFTAPELKGAASAPVAREKGEDKARHAERAATLDRLFGH